MDKNELFRACSKGGQPSVMSDTHKLIRFETTSLRSVPFGRSWRTVFGPYTIGKLYLVSGTLIHITCYSSEGVTAVCRSVRFVRIVSAVFGPSTIGKLYLVSGTYHVLFKRRRHSGLSICTVCTDRKRSFRSVYDRKIASATTSKPDMHVYLVL